MLVSNYRESKLVFGIICGTLSKLLDFTETQFSYLYCEDNKSNLRGLLIRL